MMVQQHLQVLKSELQKSKDIDPDGYVSNWIALLHFQDLNGDGLYASKHAMDTYLTAVISIYVEKLSVEEVGLLTQEAYKESEHLSNINFWEELDKKDVQPRDAGLTFTDAVEVYLFEELWRMIDAESFERETSDDETDLEEYDEEDVLDALKEELQSTISYHESKNVQEFAAKLLPYIERLEDLLLNK